MAQQTINVGAAPNDGTGTPLRTAFQYTNSNFTELYTAVGPSGNNIVVPGTATITGDLTVDTSTLKVTASNNRVGVNTATPESDLDVRGLIAVRGTPTFPSTGVGLEAYYSSANTSTFLQSYDRGGSAFANLTYSALSHIFQNSGSTAMTLNSTGLGVGIASPAVKGHFYSASGSNELRLETAATGAGSTNRLSFKSASGAADARTGAIEWYDVATFKGDIRLLKAGGIQIRNSADSPTFNLDDTGNVGIGVSPAAGTKLDVNGNLAIRDTFNLTMGFANQQRILAGGTSDNTYLTFSQWTGAAYTERMRIDQSGNVGIGVTPSAWSSIYKVSQIGQSASVSGGTSVELAVFGSNCYFDATDSRWERITSGFTSQYYQTNSTHVWRIGGNLGANTDCAFTQAMTLDASGNLMVGTTNTSASAGVGFKANYSATVPAFSVVVNDAAGTGAAYTLYNTNAAAYRFYVSNGGTIFATNTTISAISDARLKENVQDLDVGLGAILALKPRKFDWKEGKGKNIKGDRGFIAQEFETVFPNLIDEWKDPAPEGEAPYKSVRQDLIPVLVKAIQELAAEVNALKKA